MGGSDVAVAFIMLTAGVTLVAASVRLARAAHRADDLGHGEYAWGLIAAAAGFTGIAALARFPRWASGTFASLPEFVLVTGSEIAAAWLLLEFARRAHLERHGRRSRGVKTMGVILTLTAAASALLLLAAPGRILVIHGLEAVAAGLTAWSLAAIAGLVRRDPDTPRWAPALVTLGAQVLVATVFLRAFIINGLLAAGGSVATLRFVHGFGWFLAIALALPVLDVAGNVLQSRRVPVRSAAGTAAEGARESEAEAAEAPSTG